MSQPGALLQGELTLAAPTCDLPSAYASPYLLLVLCPAVHPQRHHAPHPQRPAACLLASPCCCRCFAQLSILGYILVPIFLANRWWLTLLYTLFMLVVAAAEAVSRPVQTYNGMLLQASASMVQLLHRLLGAAAPAAAFAAAPVCLPKLRLQRRSVPHAWVKPCGRGWAALT